MTNPDGGPRLHPTIDWLGAYSWRLIGIGIVGYAVLTLLGMLRTLMLALVVALLLTVVLSAPAHWLRRHGWRPLPATAVVMLGFIAVLVGAGMLIAPAVGDGFAELGPTLEEAGEDLKTWLINDSPFDVDEQRLDELQRQATDSARAALRNSGGIILRSAVVAVEILGALLLAFVLTFFFVKDGDRFQAWALRQIPSERHDVTRRLATSTWRTLAGYLRGSAMLGVIEAIIIGSTMALTGARLVVPVMVVTFLAAFVPFVGAIVAGVIAVGVALATAGFGPAIIVACVALAVQQLDNDILAPFVFGRALSMHPAVILIAIAGGAALGGLAGAFLAVPVTAVVFNGIRAVRGPPAVAVEAEPETDESGDDDSSSSTWTGAADPA
ncbi:MAG: AI-2E family transporter [Acidimicrobiales bacterium]